MNKVIHLFWAVLFLGCIMPKPTSDNSIEIELDYTSWWREIDSLEHIGFPLSALEKVRTLKVFAKKSNDWVQYLKSSIYESKYKLLREEEAEEKILENLESELSQLPPVEASILSSYLGGLYVDYLYRNAWKLTERDLEVLESGRKVGELSLNEIEKRAMRFYLQSIEDIQILRKPVLDYVDLLEISDTNATYLRPTLYDILVSKALEYVGQEPYFLSEPTEVFTLNRPEFFEPFSEFIKLRLEYTDTFSHRYQALKIYQDWMKFHLEDPEPDVRVDIDLKRLSYLWQYSSLYDKEDLYNDALAYLAEKHVSNPVYTEVSYYRANLIYHKGLENETDGLDQFALVRAHAICKDAIGLFPGSYGADLCRDLVHNIESKSVSMESEQVILPQEKALVKLHYQNIDRLHFRIVPVARNQWQRLRHEISDSVLHHLLSQIIIFQWTENLSLPPDYRRHSTEIKIPPLPSGLYGVICSSDKDFKRTGSATGYLMIFSSNWSITQLTGPETLPSFLCTHRKSGIPVLNLRAEWFVRERNISGRHPSYRNAGSTFSDSMGILNPPQQIRDLHRVIVQKGEDWLEFDGMFNRYFSHAPQEPVLKTHFFTDRSIYRPGQTIHFKGLVIKETPDSIPRLVKNYTVKVMLYDANRKVVEEKQLETSQFGSFSGSFILPASGLEGRLELSSDAGSTGTYVRVEQYRRPNFFVAIDSLKSVYRLGDTVVMSGRAEAFAGFQIGGAHFRYRVTRRAFIPWRGGYEIFRNIREKEIAIGTGKTDENGVFEFRFPAVAEPAIPRHYFPEFVFEFEVAVTDLNGESQSTKESVILGFTGYRFSIDLPDYSDAQSFSNIRLIAENYQGEPVHLKGRVVISSIQPEKAWTRERYWEAPEFAVMPEDSFKNEFPLDAYQEEHKIENWKILNEKLSDTFDTQINTLLDVSAAQWTPGAYRLEAWINGAQSPIIHFFQLWDMDNKKLPTTELLAIHSLHDQYEPGDTVDLFLSTAQYPSHVFLQTDRKGKPLERSWIILDGPFSLRIPIQETDRGGIHFAANRIYENRVISVNRVLEIPWSNKELMLELSGLPEKMTPGADHKLEVVIKAPGHQLNQAELLVTMYDASLDDLYPHKWILPQFPSNPRGYWFWNFGYGIQNGFFEQNGWNPPRESYRYRIYPDLDYFGLRFSPTYVMRSLNGAVADKAESVISSDRTEEMPLSGSESQYPDPLNDIRADLGETVFFHPDLKTDENGHVRIEFIMKDALTKWRLMAFSHTGDLSWGFAEKEFVTQKEMMIIPNMPRFLRQSDTVQIKAKLSNLTKETLEGKASLDFQDVVTGEWITDALILTPGLKAFEVLPGQSQTVSWRVSVPLETQNPIHYTFKAVTPKYSDGQSGILPILSNHLLITESMIMPVPGGTSREFHFRRFEEFNSPTLKHHSYTLAYESNPLIHVVMALPSLLEYESHCSEEVFNSLFGWTLGSQLLKGSPEITNLIKSALSSHELPDKDRILLESDQLDLNETPWLQEALNESRQLYMLQWLLDPNMVNMYRQKAKGALKLWQNEDGGFPWFRGGETNWFVTQNILEGFANMRQLTPEADDLEIKQIIGSGLKYLDGRIQQDYLKIADQVSKGQVKWSDNHLSPIRINYLYVRSMYMDYPFSEEVSNAIDFFLSQAISFWPEQIHLLKGMIALTFKRLDRPEAIPNIIRSLKEFSIAEPDKGVHWKQDNGSRWYQLPVETQALLIEVFNTLSDDNTFVEELCTWLLSHKSMNRWPTSKSTASAIYALWVHYNDHFKLADPVQILISNKKLDIRNEISPVFSLNTKYSWYGSDIKKSLSPIEIINPNKNMTWGSVQWRYFETPENVIGDTSLELSINKNLFKYEQTGEGSKLIPLTGGEKLAVGDRVRVSLQITSSQDMEFIKVKDLRAATFEPVSNLSDYRWSGGLAYYENPEDLGTNFYIDWLPRGYHRIEYDLVVNLGGNFTNGLATIESMYAPQFRSHAISGRFQAE